MLLTVEQINKLKQIIADYHSAFVLTWYGPRALPESMATRLRDLGLYVPDRVTATDAYLYGRLLQQLNTPQAAQMSFNDFQSYVRANPMQLSPIEEHAVSLAASRGAQYVVGLGNTVAQDTGRVAVEADGQLRRIMKEAIRDTVAQGIAERKTVKDIKSNLGHLTGDWTRDLDRIAATEVSLAMNEGVAAAVRDEHGDDSEVSVRSRRGCCPECEKAYKGEDGAPIIFRLTDLEANGTNYKKKKADKLPVVPPYHPNCVAQGTMVLTAHGLEPIEHITPGTLVYTHLGQLRPVTHTWATWHDGQLVTLSPEGHPSLSVTANHGVHNGLDFVAAETLTHQSAVVRVAHVVQPPYIEDNYLDQARGVVLSGFYTDGSPVTALLLPCGVYTTGGVYEVGDAPTRPLAAALLGRLMFQNRAGIPALGLSEFAKLTDARFCGPDGKPVVFARQDGPWAEAIHKAHGFFSRDYGCRAAGLRSPEDLLKDASSEVPLVAWVKKVTMACRQIGVAGYELAPRGEVTIEGRAELITESLGKVSRGRYRGFVYNLTVTEDASYIANGIVVHNCACALVHVPKGHGYTEDNRMSPIGKKGIRPHAETTKAMVAQGESLNKADGGFKKVLDWGGLRLRSVKKLDDIGHHGCALLTPGGAVPCLVGPESMASDAYIAHLPTGDHVMLGFPHSYAAALALNAHYPDTAMMSFPGHSEWSTIPIHELVGWAGQTTGDMFVMQGAGGSAGAEPEVLARSDEPAKPKRRLVPVGRLVLPITPPVRHTTPLIESPYEVVPDLSAPSPTRHVTKVPKTAPWAMPPRPQPVGTPSFVLGQEGPPDPDFVAQVADTARRRTRREPVTDIEVDQ